MGYIMDLREKVGHAPLFMPGAGVFFINETNQALLQKRQDNGLWAGTGGAMELGETFHETVRRESVEEVGLYPDELEFLGTYSGESQHYTYPNGDEVYVIAHVFVSRKYSGALKIDPEECLDAKFFSLEDLPGVDEIHPPDVPLVDDLKKYLANHR